jgi:phage I-like protein
MFMKCSSLSGGEAGVNVTMMASKSDEKRRAAGEREMISLMGARIGEGDVPSTLVVAPWGQVESKSGTFVVDQESGEEAVAAFEAHGTDLPIDYEHQTLGGVYSSPTGAAPAAGWITGLAIVPGEGLVASVTWTDQARELLAAKAYRYLSPVVLLRKSDRKVVAIHSVALTNKPAIVGMAAIVNHDAAHVADELGMELAALRERLDVDDESDVATVLAAAGARIRELEDTSRTKEIDALIDRAMSDGKLSEAQRDWATRLAHRDRALFDEWLQSAPVVVTLGRLVTVDKPGAAKSAEKGLAHRARQEYQACKALWGLTSEEAYVADALRHRIN